MATATKRALAETRKIVREEFRPVYGDRLELGRYALDPLAHLDEGHVRVLDLGTNEETVFRPWPNQREIAETWIDLDHLRETGRPRWRNVHEEKSRQEGVTWILAYLDWWALNYHTASGLVLHLKFKKVDDGGSVSTPESYFGKIRYIHSRMPDEHRAPLHFKLGQISNLYDARSFLVAEGEDSEAGRGGHYDRGVLDEAARLTWGASVHMAISRAIPHGRFYNSTPFGEDNEYARLRKARPRSFVFLTHHWTTHPVYADGLHVAAELDADTRLVVNAGDPDCDQCEATLSGEKWTARDPVAHRYPGRPTSPWYEEAILELTDTQVAQELDIDYAGSLAARVYPTFSELAHVDPDGFGYDPSLPVSFCIDYGIDATPVVFLQEAADEVRAVGEVGIVENATPDVVNGLMRQELRRIGVAEKELAPAFTLEMQGVGDPAGEARQAGTGRSLVAEYRRLGWSIVSQPRPIATTITALTRLLNGRPKPFVISDPDCPGLVDNLKHNRWPTDRQGVRKASAREPLNDRHNHACFVAGTLVTTARGDVPIERVRVGDLALTRAGFRPVVACGATGSRAVLRARWEGGEFVGTSDHPVWVRGEGWVALGDLDDTMSLYVLGETAKDGDVVAEEAESGVARVAEQAADLPRGVVVVDVEPLRVGFSEVVAAGGAAAVSGLLADEADALLRSDHRVVLIEGQAVLPPHPVVAISRSPVAIELPAEVLSRADRASSRVALSDGRPGAADRSTTVRARTWMEMLEVSPALDERPVRFMVEPQGLDAVLHVAGAAARRVLRDLPAAVRAGHARIVDVGADGVTPHRLPVFNITVAGTPEFFANGALVHNCRALAYWAAYRFPPPEPEDSIGAATLEAVRRADHSGRLDSAIRYGMKL